MVLDSANRGNAGVRAGAAAGSKGRSAAAGRAIDAKS
jgi:hypothetical protein